ncbi:unnamed protein product [Arabis nemorensis]|uniref:Uncharacterized protein n=1 Tax=Arabis nemorensis TaxID=586526 RepID=A0A565BTL9_9BRAS|nr:unnamed protein product [Arabis nemorensis]
MYPKDRALVEFAFWSGFVGLEILLLVVVARYFRRNPTLSLCGLVVVGLTVVGWWVSVFSELRSGGWRCWGCSGLGL